MCVVVQYNFSASHVETQPLRHKRVWKHTLNNGKKLTSTTTAIMIAIRQQSNAVKVPKLNGLFV